MFRLSFQRHQAFYILFGKMVNYNHENSLSISTALQTTVISSENRTPRQVANKDLASHFLSSCNQSDKSPDSGLFASDSSNVSGVLFFLSLSSFRRLGEKAPDCRLVQQKKVFLYWKHLRICKTHPGKWPGCFYHIIEQVFRIRSFAIQDFKPKNMSWVYFKDSSYIHC